ncbi:acylneuraminate cytidylyltransferase family protein [Legionella impletisoli]|uniref:Acylneuraminate cytidylyltransferase n=1 Tax=Legionella impletisoli TaxID=343510 RepID=A0A917JR52_9GAMM|nr:acylneuraminate cytidylyltransferase family protein [Legionella impletisoli]GGI82154.1 acylneuraminate cytidylyltransferase [Legionella impletisoli]
MRRLAVIPARGGSKRLEKKNILNFHGKPLIYWTIISALNSKLFDDVIVSTDDEEIAKISVESGASVPFLRKAHADDFSPVSLVTINVLEHFKSMKNVTYDLVVQLMPNCPLRNDKNINDAVNYFESRNIPSQISCFRYGWMNPWWAVELDKNNNPSPLFKEALTKRSQDLPNLFCPSGAIWIAKPEFLIKAKTFYCRGHIFWEMPWKAAIDIDDEADLFMAKSLFMA